MLKRDMELAMLDSLVGAAKAQGIKKLYGYYYKTAKSDGKGFLRHARI